MELALAVERVLSSSGVLQAPARLNGTVAREIIVRARARRRAESVGIAGACVAAGVAAAFGVSRALDWGAAGSALIDAAESLEGSLARLAELSGAPHAIDVLSQDPAVTGVVLACAASAAAFLAVSGLRVARQCTPHRRQPS
jgi:hypothetical protein